MKKLSKICFVWVMLLYVGSLAWNTKGLVDCNGLFLLDMKDRRARGYDCLVTDSTRIENWAIRAGYGFFDLDAMWSYEGENEYYTWDFESDNFLNLGFASVQADFKFLSARFDVATLPFAMASVHWHFPDSLVYASAYAGLGRIDSVSMRWESAVDLDIVPVVNGVYGTDFDFLRFDFGMKWRNFLADVGFTYGDTDPLTDRVGYVFSDSSEFWTLKPALRYKGDRNEFSLDYVYVYADMDLFALLREEKNEKRFFFLPIGLDVNLVSAEYTHYGAPHGRGSKATARATYGQIYLNIPWEDRRFYETLAPNRALSSSFLKTLSFSVYTRNFRLYGVGDLRFAHVGGGYEWDLVGGGWHFGPNASLDLLYADANIELKKRTETANVLSAEHFTDTTSWSADFFGALLNIGFGLESPRRRFFAAISISQIIPFCYHLKDNLQEPVPEVPVVEPVIPVEPVVPVEEPDDEEPLKIFRNGFAIGMKIGLFF